MEIMAKIIPFFKLFLCNVLELWTNQEKGEKSLDTKKYPEGHAN